MKQLRDNNPHKYVIALLLETIAEEFPQESCECDNIIIITAPFLIVVDRRETLMQRSGYSWTCMWHSSNSGRCGGADLGQAAHSYSYTVISDVMLFKTVLTCMVGHAGEIL
jgi:hypothetical protein